MARQRAPGGGRKPKGSAPMRSQLTIRIPDDMRAELEAAARKRGRNISEELLVRLRVSFARERELDRERATRALMYMLAAAADLPADLAKFSRLPKRPWTRDPFLFRSFKLSAAQLLDALEPPGDPQSFDLKSGNKPLPFNTPEELADFMTKELLWALSEPDRLLLRAKARDAKPSDDEVRGFYAVSNVRRDLGIHEPKSSKKRD